MKFPETIATHHPNLKQHKLECEIRHLLVKTSCAGLSSVLLTRVAMDDEVVAVRKKVGKGSGSKAKAQPKDNVPLSMDKRFNGATWSASVGPLAIINRYKELEAELQKASTEDDDEPLAKKARNQQANSVEVSNKHLLK